MPNEIELKSLGGRVLKTKIIERDGVKIGVVEGYIATWDLDRGDFWGVRDQFVKGAFKKSLADLRKRNRPIRLKDHHGRTVGGFPIETAKEDNTGLFAVGEINLDVQQGAEAYALAKQGVLSDFSIGFTVEKSTMDEQEDIRTISEAVVWEGSIVDEPMNPFANITAVKEFGKMNDEQKVKLVEFLKQLKEESTDEEKDLSTDVSETEIEGKISIEKFKELDERDVEGILKGSGLFSNNVCKLIASRSVEKELETETEVESTEMVEEKSDDFSQILASIKNSQELLKSDQ